MYSELLFVPDSLGDQKRKELIDSSCRAHNMRIVHRKRRAMRDVQKPSSQNGFDHESNPDLLRYSSEPQHDASTTHGLPRSMFTMTISKSQLLEIPVQSACSPSAMKAVEFVRFHLVKSWSPTFMLRIYDANIPGTDLDDHLAIVATRWMWSMWQSDSNLFWSVVASILPLMARYVSHDQKAEVQNLALELRAHSFQGLMTTLKNFDEIPDHKLLTTIYLVKSLFREACANGDLEAARHHSDALTRLALRLHEHDRSIEHRRIALWGDALPALLQLRRPVVDFSVAMAQITMDIWSISDSNFKIASRHVSTSTSYVSNETLKKAFKFFGEAVHIIGDPRMIGTECRNMSTESIFQWMTSKAEHHICELLHLYHDFIDDENTWNVCTDLSKGERCIEASTCLTLLYLYQKAFFDIYQDDGTDVNECALLIQPALTKTLQLAERLCSRSEWMFHRRLVFWMMFIGAWAEQNLNRALRYSDYITTRDNWCTANLPKHVRCAGLASWSDAREALGEFGWAGFLCEEAQQWYDKVVLQTD